MIVLKPGSLVGSGSHDKVIQVQAADPMGPPVNHNPAPFHLQSRVVIFLLGKRRNPGSEIESQAKVFKPVFPYQPGHSVLFLYYPAW
jgi:hypothetical protein